MKIMDVHDFPRLLGKIGKNLIPPKFCASLDEARVGREVAVPSSAAEHGSTLYTVLPNSSARGGPREGAAVHG